MSEFYDRFAGRAAAVLGGGPSLPGDMNRLPEGCVLIAVNYHAFLFCKPDFVVYNDDPGPVPAMMDVVRNGGAVRVSPDRMSTDVVFDVDVWTGFYSSNTAAWFASWMGCAPVILCGMDCYQGERKYCHDFAGDAPCLHYPLEHHIRPWMEDARNLCRHPERIVAMSGPLVGVFGRYETADVLWRFPRMSVPAGGCRHGKKVRWHKLDDEETDACLY